VEIAVLSAPPGCRQWEDTVRQAAQAALSQVPGWDQAEVSILLTDDRTIRQLNQAYRDEDRVTDVLSFSQVEGDNGDGIATLLGDVIISVEQAARQAQAYGHPMAREMGFLTVHGVLHLLGWDHEEPEQERQMMALTEAILSSIGLTREGVQ
jgi:probable rRNA maturation factor